MFKRIHNKKGFLFPFTYVILATMTIYVAVFANRALNDHNITKRNLLGIQSKYQTLRGIECMIYELLANGSDWHTHTAEQELENGPYALIPLTEQGQIPDVALSQYSKINEEGNYAAIDGGFQGKAYKSPETGTVFLCQGVDDAGGLSFYAAKIHYDSVYEYFIFTPFELELSHITLDAMQGRIHSNKDIVFGDKAIISNLATLTTPEAIRYFVESYIPEGSIPLDPYGRTWEEYYYWLRDPWVEPNKDGEYRNRNDGHLSGEKTGLLMENPRQAGRYIEYDPLVGNPPLYPNDYPELYQDSNLISTVNGNQLPNRLQELYPWNKYWRACEDFPNIADIIGVMTEAKYTNSAEQPGAWETTMLNLGLTDIIQEANTGGEEVDALTVSSYYYKLAAEGNGMTIVKSGSSVWEIELAGNPYIIAPGGKITEDGEVVFERKSFVNTNSSNTNEVLVIYVDKMIEKGMSPSNGIIHGNNINILLDNAEALPDGGLTTFANGSSIYIKGDYNTQTWQPSVAIAGGKTYLLSDEFNYPQQLPVTVHNLEYPYVDDYVEGEYNWYHDNEPNMANKVTVDKDYTYVVSLISNTYYMPDALERWSYYENPGDIDIPPSDLVERKRHVIGSLIKVGGGMSGQWPLDLNTQGSRQRTNPGWPEDMGSVIPQDLNNFFSYDDHYLDGSNPRPPGDFMSSNIKLFMPMIQDIGNWYYWPPELN